MKQIHLRASRSGADGLIDVPLFFLIAVGFFIGPLKLLGNSWFSYLLPDVLAVLVLVVVLGKRLAEGRPLFAASGLSVPMLILAGFCVLELANPEAPFVRSVLGVRSWLLYLGFYFVGLYILRSLQQMERLYFLLLLLGVITAIYGMYQWRAGPESFANWSEYYGQWARITWSAHAGSVFRAFSTFVNPGTFALNMALIMLLAFSAAASRNVPIGWRLLAACAFVVMGGGIAVSGSRGPAVHLLIAGVAALFLIPGIWTRVAVAFKVIAMIGVTVALGAFIVGPIVSERFFTIFDLQTSFWKWFGPFLYGIGIALEHPFGMGLGYTAGVPRFTSDVAIRDLPTTNVDSGYGSAAAELGLLGLIVFAYFAFRVGLEGFRAWRTLRPGRLRDLCLGPALMATTYPIVTVIFQPQAALPSAIYFWLLIGMLMKAQTIQREHDADQLLAAEMRPGE